MRSKRTLAICLASFAVLAVPALAFARPLQIGGSTSVQPLAEKLAAAYHTHTHHPKPVVRGCESDCGLTEVAKGKINIGDVSRNPQKSDESLGVKLTWTKIAKDAVCVITNDRNAVPDLSQQTVERIFTGAYTNWSQVPGSPLKGKVISVFDRNGSSGTQDAFQHIFFRNPETTEVTHRASAENSNGLERSNVAGTEGAIGFVSHAFTHGVHPVPYQGVGCTLHNARAGLYAGVRNFWMVTKGKPKGETLRFLRWVTSGNRITKDIINSEWIAIH